MTHAHTTTASIGRILSQDQPLPPGAAGGPHKLIPSRVEEAIIGALIAYPGEQARVIEALPASEFGDPHTSVIAQALWTITENNPAQFTEGVPRAVLEEWLIQHDRMAGLPPRYIQRLEDEGVHVVVRSLAELCGIVHQLAHARKAARVGAMLTAQVEANPTGYETAVNEAQEHLASVGLAGTAQRRDPRVRAVQASARAYALAQAQANQQPGRTTGLGALDRLIKRQRCGRIYGMMGRWKGRKTSLMAFMTMRALEEGASVGWYTLADGTREDVHARFAAMLATVYLRKHFPGAPELWTVSAENLPLAWREPEQQEAIGWAEERIATRYADRLRIYDAQDGIMDLGTLTQSIRTDSRLYRGEIAVVDYLQAAHVEGLFSDYEVMRETTRQLLRVGKERNLINWWLLQRNTAANAEDAQDRAGVRGGDEVIQSVDYLLRVRYNESTPSVMGLGVFAGRYAGRDEWWYTINPASGLVLNPQAAPEALRSPEGLAE